MKILLIDHHALFREGMRHLLQCLPGGVDEILEAADFSIGLSLARQNPDLILLELNAPDCAGATAVKTLRRHYSGIPIVVVSSEEDTRVINLALSYGANGYVCKSASSGVLLGALNIALKDGIYIPIQLLPSSKIQQNKLSSEYTLCRPKNKYGGLTPRQKHILGYLIDGLTNKEISHTINLAEGTVKVHVASIFQILRVHKRSQAAQVARDLGLH